jgi:hypothetical protein
MTIRERLAEAIARRAALAAQLESAIAAQGRGEGFEREAQAEYDRFGDADDRIIDARARRIADWAKAGNGPLDEAWFDIDGELTEARRLRDEARERLTAATDACVQLRRAANRAQEEYTTAKDRVTYLVGDLLVAEAVALARDYDMMLRGAWQLEDKLRALAGLWVVSGRRAPTVAAALGLTRPTFDGDRPPGMPFGVEHQRALWQEFAARLQDDAGAEWTYRPPRPEDRTQVNPFAIRAAVAPFRPTSLDAAERDDRARQARAEAPLHPFAASTAEMVMTLRDRQLGEVEAERQTAAQKYRAEREAVARLVEEAEGG